MHRIVELTGSLALVAALAISPPAHADEHAASAAMDPAAMQAAWDKAMKPREEHAMLAQLVGTWTAESRYRPAPDAEWETSPGESVFTGELGGRFVSQRYKGAMMGMEFEGIGFYGYDNLKEELEWLYATKCDRCGVELSTDDALEIVDVGSLKRILVERGASW